MARKVRLICISWSKVYFKWLCAIGIVQSCLLTTWISTKESLLNVLPSSFPSRRMRDTKQVVVHPYHPCRVTSAAPMHCKSKAPSVQHGSTHSTGLTAGTTQNDGQCWISCWRLYSQGFPFMPTILLWWKSAMAPLDLIWDAQIFTGKGSDMMKLNMGISRGTEEQITMLMLKVT